MHIVLFLILIGFISGYFLATKVLVILSVTSIVIGIFLKIKMKEMAELYAVAFIGAAIIVNTMMWVTNYIVTKQTWLQDILGNLLR